MSTKRTLTVTLPDGTTATRTTARTYTHAVVVKRTAKHLDRIGRDLPAGVDVEYGVITWCGSEELAAKQLRSLGPRWGGLCAEMYVAPVDPPA